MIEFMTGFALADVVGATMAFNGYATTFTQASIIDGPPIPKPQADTGKAFYLFNTSFGEANLIHIWPHAQSTVGVHMHVKFASVSANNTSELVTSVMDWFQVSSGPGAPILTLHLASGGTMWVVANESGVVAGVLSQAFLFDTWYEIELQTGYAGWEVKVNGSTAGKSSSPISNAHADRAGFRWQGFGPPGVAVANYVLWDDRPGDGIHDFIGPCWVSTLPLLADVNTSWTPTPAGSITAALRDPLTPDGDASYAMPVTALTPQLFTLDHSPCFGLVLAVAVNVCARPVGANQIVSAWMRPQRALYELGSLEFAAVGTKFTGGYAPALDNYSTLQVLSTKSPESGQPWVDSEISSGQWGIEPADSGNLAVRVTQFYVSKLTTLLPKPYGCGGGNYVY